MVYLGTFATAEEAALHVVRSPEGQAAVAAPPPPLLSSEEEDKGKVPAMPTGAVLKEKGAAPPMPPGAYVEEEELALPLLLAKEDALVPPYTARCNRHGRRRDPAHAIRRCCQA